MDNKKIKEKEWKFKKTREKLIKMVESWMDKKWSKSIAMDIVDAIFLETCEYKQEQFNKKWDSLIDEAREVLKNKGLLDCNVFQFTIKTSKKKKSDEE